MSSRSKGLADEPAMRELIERSPDQEFVRELCTLIEDFSLEPGIAGVHAVEALEGAASVLRKLGWAQ